MRKQILGICFLFLGLLLTPDLDAQKPNWAVFTSHAGKVKMKFPDKPEVELKKSAEGEGYSVKTAYQDRVYMLTFILHNKKLPQDPGWVQKVVDGFLNASKGKALSQTDFKYKKCSGKEAIIEIGQNKVTIDFRVLITGQVQYQYMVISPLGNRDPKTTKKFFKSLKLLKN